MFFCLIRNRANSLPKKVKHSCIRFFSGKIYKGCPTLSDHQALKIPLRTALITFWNPVRVCLNHVIIDFRRSNKSVCSASTFTLLETLFRRANANLGLQYPMSIGILEINFYNFFWYDRMRYVTERIIHPIRVDCVVNCTDIFKSEHIFHSPLLDEINILHNPNQCRNEIYDIDAVRFLKFLMVNQLPKNKIFVVLDGQIDLRFLYSLLGDLQVYLENIPKESRNLYVERYLWRRLDINVQYKSPQAWQNA